MPFREWLKRLFERAHPVWEDDAEKFVDGRGYVTSDRADAPVKVKAPRKSKKKAKKK